MATPQWYLDCTSSSYEGTSYERPRQGLTVVVDATFHCGWDHAAQATRVFSIEALHVTQVPGRACLFLIGTSAVERIRLESGNARCTETAISGRRHCHLPLLARKPECESSRDFGTARTTEKNAAERHHMKQNIAKLNDFEAILCEKGMSATLHPQPRHVCQIENCFAALAKIHPPPPPPPELRGVHGIGIVHELKPFLGFNHLIVDNPSVEEVERAHVRQGVGVPGDFGQDVVAEAVGLIKQYEILEEGSLDRWLFFEGSYGLGQTRVAAHRAEPGDVEHLGLKATYPFAAATTFAEKMNTLDAVSDSLQLMKYSGNSRGERARKQNPHLFSKPSIQEPSDIQMFFHEARTRQFSAGPKWRLIKPIALQEDMTRYRSMHRCLTSASDFGDADVYVTGNWELVKRELDGFIDFLRVSKDLVADEVIFVALVALVALCSAHWSLLPPRPPRSRTHLRRRSRSRTRVPTRPFPCSRLAYARVALGLALVGPSVALSFAYGFKFGRARVPFSPDPDFSAPSRCPEV
ncbi:hypothetical protein C8R43DRAFT_966166 [Mycena crocata]|nr:hypothetical protein C8R43DRAFT_966166 [Mycena crocata]